MISLNIKSVKAFFMFTVYILFSSSCKKFYTGHSADVVNRMKEHNSGETQSIKSCIPWSIVWKCTLASRSEAMQLESKIKKRGARRFLADANVDLSRGA